MPRLSVSLSDAMHNRLSSMAIKNKDSISSMVNRLLHIGMEHIESDNEAYVNSPVEKHCQLLIIQMNALIKNLSSELLKLDQDDFEELKQAALDKVLELSALNN